MLCACAEVVERFIWFRTLGRLQGDGNFGGNPKIATAGGKTGKGTREAFKDSSKTWSAATVPRFTVIATD